MDTNNTIDQDITTHHEHNHSHKSHTLEISTPVAIIIGSIILSLGLVGYGYASRAPTTGTPSTVFNGKEIGEGDYVEGVSKKVFVIEYSDTECPYCLTIHPELKKIREEYSSKVGFVYRHFPLNSIHPGAQKEAEAISCAGKIGGSSAYYKYMTSLFDYKVSTGQTQLAGKGVKEISELAGVSADKINECLRSDEMKQVVLDSIDDGVAAGVQGTPTTYIVVKERGKYTVVASIEGARPYSYIKQAIDQALEYSK